MANICNRIFLFLSNLYKVRAASFPELQLRKSLFEGYEEFEGFEEFEGLEMLEEFEGFAGFTRKLKFVDCS